MKKQTHKILIFLMLLGLLACTPSKYVVTKQSVLVKLNLDKTVTNFIPVSDEDLNKSKLLDSAYNLIIWKDYSKLKKYIASMEASKVSTSDIYLAKALLSMVQKRYADATISLDKVKASDYGLLKRLLSIDLMYEIHKSDEESNYNELLKKYQDLIDAYPDDVILKKIVLIRMRYLRYNY